MKQTLSAVVDVSIIFFSCQKHRIVICFLCLFFTVINLFGQAPPIQWQKCLGGSSEEWTPYIQMTTDGEYIVATTTYSNDGNVSGNHGEGDIWVMKLSQTGVIQWQKSLGGSGNEQAIWIQQTTDGGYIVLGSTTSNDGDVSGWHAGYDIDGNPAPDYWVIKLDNVGTIQWQKCLGGSDKEEPYYGYTDHPILPIQQTTDGGYIIIGATVSNNGDVSGWRSGYDTDGYPYTDCWVVKLNNVGAIQWQTLLGGSSLDVGYSIYQAPDGGYILAGLTASNNGDVSGWHPGGSVWNRYSDGWVVKLNSIGAIQWQKCLGGSSNERAYSIQFTPDGGYIIVGFALSNDGDVSGNHGSGDIWLVKLSQTGIIQSQKCLGGSGYEDVRSIKETTDGGYIIAGVTGSNDGNVSGWHAGNGTYGIPFSDYWIVKLNNAGNIQWQKCLGGSGSDDVHSIQQTTDAGYIVIGETRSNNGDVSGWHPGYNEAGTSLTDCWVVKLNNAGNIQWQKCLGGSGDDGLFNSIYQTTDGGYISAGMTMSNDGDVSGYHGYEDVWIFKLGFNNPLPIKITSINAHNQGNVNIINWSSASEEPGESYELQRSNDGVRFSAIASLPGSGRAADYQYTDSYLIPGVNYYRVLLINNDGHNTYSNIVTAFVKTNIELRLSPNPANEILNIQIRGSVVSKASLQIIDGTGKTVLLSKLINNEPKKINISTLAPGVYFLSYRDDQHEIVKKFVVN